MGWRKMKNFLILLLSIAVSTNALAAASQNDDLKPAVVNTAANYLNNLSIDVLTMLQIIAATQEAQQGDWKNIKPYLTQAFQRVPGVYFYVLPDGNYYSLEKDYTNLNLSNRGYFKSLFEGNSVKGYEIYSRSSGKKSAVMATPILVDGNVKGALGVSIFLDKLHHRFNKEIGLPDNYTWFVVNSDGLVMLDMDNDFIFMNTLTQGTNSLKNAIGKSLQNESGTIEYEIGNSIRKGVYKKLPALDWWMVLAKKEDDDSKDTSQLEISLKTFVPELQSSLNTIDSNMQKRLANTKSHWNNEKNIRETLNKILSESPSIFEALFVDEKGHIKYIEPREYVNFEGADISTQEHVIALLKKQMPVFSSGFNAVEGFPAVDIAYPVFDINKKFKGSLSLLIRPELMLRSLLKQVRIPDDYELWVMQTDGMVIYDDDPQEIGKNLFTDPSYAEYESLKQLAYKISSTPQGADDYVYQKRGGQDKVVKAASWDTVSLFGRNWRVVLAHPVR